MEQTSLKAKKVMKFYTTVEKKELAPFISGKISASDENLKEFCEKHQRPVGGVRAYIYGKKTKKSYDKKLTKAVSMPKAAAVVTKDEFVIPITKWEIRTDGVNNSLVLHFSK